MALDPWTESLFRWTHAVTGIGWSGCLIASAFVTNDVGPHENAAERRWARWLSPLRWGATSTWLTGILLTIFEYYSTEKLVRHEVRLETKRGITADYILATDTPVLDQAAAVTISVSCIVLAFFGYELIWRSVGKHARVATVACYSVFLSVLYLLSLVFTGRAVLMHAGAMLGSTLAVNGWLQTRVVDGEAPRRTEHDVYIAGPALLLMSGMHSAAVHDRHAWLVTAAALAASWAVTRAFYGRPRRATIAAPSRQES